MSQRKLNTVLVLYHARGTYPLRHAIRSHLYCWKQYSHAKTIYINVAFGLPDRLLQANDFDVIIFDTSYMAMRWRDKDKFLNSAFIKTLNKSNAVKVIVPQDEFVYGNLISLFCNSIHVDLILSCADLRDQARIYENLKTHTHTIHQVLTGYLDDSAIKITKRLYVPIEKRGGDVAYRAWNVAYWLGEHAHLKVRIAEVFKTGCQRTGLAENISIDEKDVISGAGWFRFLANTRAVIGVEGGASVLDLDGHIKEKVETYMAEHPDATFGACRKACFASDENSLSLFCISPRHLEAVMMKTCQILVRGNYNGILEPNVDYIPVEKDFSNLDEALERLKDTASVEQMTERAYMRVVNSGLYNYSRFVRDTERLIVDTFQPKLGKNLYKKKAMWFLKLKDTLNWQIIRAEVAYSKNPELFKPIKFALKPLYLFLVKKAR